MSCYTYKGIKYTEQELKSVLQDEQPKVRRILELQSDLFQKGRDSKDLVDKKIASDIKQLENEPSDSIFDVSNALNDLKNKQKENLKNSDNQFLQLLNQKGNWVNFFIQSIVQDSISKGYEKVLFPTGETAAKIEGHQTMVEDIKKTNKIINLLEESKVEKNPEPEVYPGQEYRYKSSEFGDYTYRATEELAEEDKYETIQILRKRNQDRKEQGLEKLKPIEAFYANRVTNILNKLYEVNKVTDSSGNTWNEVILPEVSAKFVLESKMPFKSPQDVFFQNVPLNSNGFIKNYTHFQRRIYTSIGEKYGLVLRTSDPRDNGRAWAYFHTFSRKAMTVKQLEAHFKNKGVFSSLIDNSIEPSFTYNVPTPSKSNVVSVNEVTSKELISKVDHILFNSIHQPTSALEVIRNIKKSNIKLSAPFMQILPKLLKSKASVKFVKASQLNSEDTFMQYDPVSDTIEVAIENFGLVKNEEVAVAKFLHEVMHSITYNSINNANNTQKKELLNKVDAYFIEAVNSMTENEKREYAHQISSLDEFVAGMFENTDFQELIKDKGGIWNRFINAIRIFLGLDTSFTSFVSDVVNLADVESPAPNFINNTKKVLESKTDYKLDSFKDLEDFQSSIVTPSETNNFYGFLGEQYNRATRFLGQSSTVMTEDMETAAEFGNSIDKLSKNIFDGIAYSYAESDKKIKSSHFNQLSSQMKAIKKQIEAEAPGVTFKTDFYAIDKANKTIGELDILAIYPDGSKRVIDMKSIKSGLTYYDNNTNKFEGYRAKHTRQTNYYSNLIEFTGSKIKPPYIIAVQPEYNAGDNVIGRFKPIKDGKVVTLIKLERDTEVLKSSNPYVQEKINKAQANHKAWMTFSTSKDEFAEINLKKLDKLTRRLMDNIKQYANMSRHAGTSYFEEVDKLHKDMEKRLRKDVKDLNNLSYLETINEFLSFSNTFFVKTSKRFDTLIANDYYDFEEYTSLYNKSHAYISSFDIISDLESLLLELHKEGTISNEENDELITKFKSVAAYKNLITTKLQHIRKTVAEKTFTKSKYNKKIEIDFKEKYGKEFEDKHGAESFFRGKKTKDWAKAKKQYVAEQMFKNRDLIEKETVKYVKELLDNPTVDLSDAGFAISSDPIINNPFIQMQHNLLLEGHDNYKIEVGVGTQELARKAKELNLKKKDFKALAEVDSKGNHYLRGEFKLAFYEKFKELQRDVNNAEDPIQEAKKEKVLKKWLRANSTKSPKTGLYVPIDKWRNSFSDLSNAQKEALDLFKKVTMNSAQDTHFRKSLVQKVNNKSGAVFYRMPAILATTFANAEEGKILDAVKKKFNEMFTVEKDDTEEGASLDKTGKSNVHRVYTDVSGKPIDTLAINYRSLVGEKQNMDLFTVYALELENGVRFKNNYKMETTSLIFRDFIKEKKFINTRGFTKSPLLSIFKDIKLEDYDTISGESSNTYKKLDSMIKNRVFNVTNVYAGKIAGADANRVVGSLIQYSSMLGMAVNIPGATNNLVTGMLSNFIDAHGGDIISKQNIKDAFIEYNRNIPGLMADIGRPSPENIINLLLLRFDVMGDYSQLKNQFERNNKIKQLLKSDTTTGLHGLGEHAMHGVMMISILKSAKVMNKQGKWVNKDGAVVSTMEEAASVYDSFFLDKEGTLRNKDIGFTSFDSVNSWNDGGSFSVKGLIKDKIYRTQGAYDQSMNGHWQKYWYGKLFLHFKKFFESLLLNRLRGIGHANKKVGDLTDDQLYYNYNSKNKEFGYYTTFFRNIIQSVKQNKFDILRYRGTFKENWKGMTDHERSNMRKAILELSIISFIGSLAALIAGAAADDDDDLLWFFAYLAMRQKNELGQFYNPAEAWRIIQNPIASVRQLQTITNSLSLLMAPFEWGEEYESGINAGEKKIKVKFKKMVVPSSFNFDAKRMYNFYDLN